MTAVLLSAKNLSVQFGGVWAVNDISFDVNKGEVLTLIGPNGAGKTTVFNLISRIYPATSGDILFQGHSLRALAPDEIASYGIARTFQNIELFEHASVLQNLLIGCHRHHKNSLWKELIFTQSVRETERRTRRKVEEVMEFLRLQRYRDALVHTLPYGTRKIVELARAMASDPTLLLLDEPSSGLNVDETSEMAQWIQSINSGLGVTVLMVEHDMSLVSRVSDRVLAMSQGQVLALGTPAQVQSHSGVIEAYLGTAGDLANLRRNRGVSV